LNPLESLIFDLDGTLIDSSDGVVEAFNYSLRMMNQPEQKPEVIKQTIGYPLPVIYPRFTDAPIEELYKYFQEKAAEVIIPSTSAFEGVDLMLRKLHSQGYRMAVASTKIQKHINGIIKKLGWDGLFEIALGGDKVKRVKPAPDIFLSVMDEMNISTDNSMVIGDTINDVLAAKAIPLKVVAVKSPYGGEEEIQLSRPDFYINKITELPELLNKISENSGKK